MPERIAETAPHTVLLNVYTGQGYHQLDPHDHRPSTRIGFSISPPLTAVFNVEFLNEALKRVRHDKTAWNESRRISIVENFKLSHSDTVATYGSFIVRKTQEDILANEVPMIHSAEDVFTEALYPDGSHISVTVSSGGHSGSEM
jgi:hypothetical protein